MKEGVGKDTKWQMKKCPPGLSDVTAFEAKGEGVYLVFILHFIISPPIIHWLLYAPLTTVYH